MASVAQDAVRPQLYSGDRLSRDEFHRAYAHAPKSFHAELIGGVVYVASPVGEDHAFYQALLVTILTSYAMKTPGVRAGDNATLILGDDTEPQPDVLLRIEENYGGRARKNSDGYVEGPPEYDVEVSHSSRAIDLNAKYDAYTRNGIEEYLVYCIKEREIHWFDLQNGRKLSPDENGVIRVNSFPGLWIDGTALRDLDYERIELTLQSGIDSPDHKEFIARLAAYRP